MNEKLINDNLFERIICPENLFRAWDEFVKGKRYKPDILLFERDLEQNIFQLFRDLKDKTYRHGAYTGFFISDPKRRHIHKATVRDRVLHHAIFRILNPIYESTFISTSFSCRAGKGTHKGVLVVGNMLRAESHNHFRTCYALKCDIGKFFDSVDHKILLSILARKVKDEDVLRLLEQIIGSFTSVKQDKRNIGVPIGNLTSQLFANIYLGELDQFIKYTIQAENYVRYTDDFIIISSDRLCLQNMLAPIRNFLRDILCLELHPHKISMRKFRQGIDFLGYVLLPHYMRLRNKTQRRIERKLKEKTQLYKTGSISQEKFLRTWNSYGGVLSHANTYTLRAAWEGKYQIKSLVKNNKK